MLANAPSTCVTFMLRIHGMYCVHVYVLCCLRFLLSVYVFHVGDNLRSRNKCVIPLCSSVTCIKYFDSCVYVGLDNGSLAVFETDEGQLI